MAFCVGGIELTSQLKITRNRGKPFVDEVMSRCCHVMIITRVRWRSTNFIFTIHYLVMVGSDKTVVSFQIIPVSYPTRTLTPNINIRTNINQFEIEVLFENID